jgi:hypothetical protein
MSIHRHLKRWFIPHKRNDHRPHLIRSHGLATMAILIIGLQATALAVRSSAPMPLVHGGNVLDYAIAGDITPIELLTLTNQERANNGLPPLSMNAKLNTSATLKAQNMFAEDYWNHVSPSCIQPWHWFTQAGYNYTYAGENLAKDFNTSSGVMAGWMNSPGHRANILNVNYKEVGFAVMNGDLPYPPTTPTASCTAATPQTNGHTTLVVAHYGQSTATVAAPAATPRPLAKAAVTPVPVPSATPVPTPVATPTPSPSPSPSASHKPNIPAVEGEVSAAAPAGQSYSLFKPLSLLKTLSWNTLITILLLLVLLIVYAITHLAVWRKGLKRWGTTHYRLYAAAQIGGLTVVIVLLSISGYGRVG